MIYVIGSLRNPEVPRIAQALREKLSEEIFDDWYAAGPEADDYWRDYEKLRGHTLPEALQGLAARNVYAFDRKNLERATTVILVLPAGKSGHLELGWALGQGKKGYILLDNDPERYDVMYQFANGVFNKLEELINELRKSTALPEPEYITWYDASNPRITRISSRTKNPNYVPPDNQLCKKHREDNRVYLDPATSAHCSTCPSCIRDLRYLRGNRGMINRSTVSLKEDR